VALNLGSASVVANIPEAMTHVVVGDNKRTMKVFFGLGMGCFIVKPDWLWQSLAAGKWLPEEEFEGTYHLPTIALTLLPLHVVVLILPHRRSCGLVPWRSASSAHRWYGSHAISCAS
jgi:hypothetical protein